MLVFNSSPLDYHHGRKCAEQIARLMPNVQLGELPCERLTEVQDRSREGTGLFTSIPPLAPQLIGFDQG